MLVQIVCVLVYSENEKCVLACGEVLRQTRIGWAILLKHCLLELAAMSPIHYTDLTSRLFTVRSDSPPPRSHQQRHIKCCNNPQPGLHYPTLVHCIVLLHKNVYLPPLHNASIAAFVLILHDLPY